MIKLIYDPYLIIPGYGENSIDVNFNKGNLYITIFYDCQKDNCEKKIEMSFINTRYYKCNSFPGISDSKYTDEKYSNISSLVELENSELKKAWELHFNNLFIFKHFKIHFISANYVFETICEDIIINSNRID